MRQSIAAGIALIFCAANSASAYIFSPTQTKFTLTGSAEILLGGGYNGCTLTMTGKIPHHSKNAVIETFSDNGTCGVTATNLPWALRAKNATTAEIIDFAYTVPGNVCGPTNAHPMVSGSGVWTLQTRVEGTTGVCRLLTTLTSKPPITIVR